MSKFPVSVHILTWNSGQTLERALESVQECKEILVIDGGSTDDTLEIAGRFGATVLPQRVKEVQGRPLLNFAAARNIGLENTMEPWILALDSDEMMSTQAMEEIKKITERASSTKAYFVPRHYLLDDGSRIDRASTYPNERIYFFRKDAVERWEKPVHERVRLKAGVRLSHLQHGSLAPLPPIGVFVSKLNQYLTIEREASRWKGWGHWLARVAHTLRSRLIATLRLLWIWLIPGRGKRLPLRYEMARFWYSGRLLIVTCPLAVR